MATLTVSGTVRDTRDPQQVVVGATVQLVDFNVFPPVVEAVDTTDSNGEYEIQTSDPGSGQYSVSAFKTPHFAVDSEFVPPWDGDFNESFVRNLVCTFSNNAPTTSIMSNRSYPQGSSTQTGDFTMSDADGGDVLTPVKVSGDVWGTISKPNSSTGRWTWNLSGVALGNYQFQYRADDNWGGVGTVRTVQVSVVASNSPPTLNSPGNKTYLNKSGPQTFQLAGSDPDGDSLSFSKTSGPTWVSCSSSGLVTVNTNSATRGVHSVTYRVSDGRGGTNDKTHSITIQNNVPVFQQPSSPQYGTDTGTKTLPFVISDADGDSTVLSRISGPAWGSPSGSSAVFAIAGVVAGIYEFVWQVVDGQGGSVQRTHNVTLVEPVPAPFFQVMT